MKTYTQQQAAKILNLEIGTIFDRMTGGTYVGEHGAKQEYPYLMPSIIIEKPVLMGWDIPIDCSTTAQHQQELSGVFEITGHALRWDADGNAPVTFEMHREGSGIRCVYLYRDGIKYRMLQSGYSVKRDELVVTAEELLRYGEAGNNRFELPHFEQENSMIVAPLPPYLDPEHKYYAPELAALVEVWLELYEGGKYNEKAAHKSQISALLKKKGLSATAIKEIARAANPNKDGGATKTV